MNKLATLMKEISALSLDEKRSLNSALVEMIRSQHTVVSAIASSQFSVGDVVSFVKSGRGRNAGTHYIKIAGFNRARTAVIGEECDRTGKRAPMPIRWTVSSTSCTKV